MNPRRRGFVVVTQEMRRFSFVAFSYVVVVTSPLLLDFVVGALSGARCCFARGSFVSSKVVTGSLPRVRKVGQWLLSLQQLEILQKPN